MPGRKVATAPMSDTSTGSPMRSFRRRGLKTDALVIKLVPGKGPGFPVIQVSHPEAKQRLIYHRSVLASFGITDISALGTLNVSGNVVPQPGLTTGDIVPEPTYVAGAKVMVHSAYRAVAASSGASVKRTLQRFGGTAELITARPFPFTALRTALDVDRGVGNDDESTNTVIASTALGTPGGSSTGVTVVSAAPSTTSVMVSAWESAPAVVPAAR